MTYRNDRDADRARIDELEAELTRSREQLDELRGQRSQALVVASKGELARGGGTARRKIWGAPMRLAFEHEFDQALPAEQLEELVAVIRRVAGTTGRIELLRASLQWFANANPGLGPVVTVTIKEGHTRLEVTEALASQAGGVHAVGLSLGATALFPLFMSLALPLASLVSGLWLGTTFLGSRVLFRRLARRRAEALHQLFEALREDIRLRLETLNTSENRTSVSALRGESPR